MWLYEDISLLKIIKEKIGSIFKGRPQSRPVLDYLDEQDLSRFSEQDIILEPLASGGIFKMTRAPSKPGIQIWSGIIAHPEGMITFTKSIDIVDEI